MDGVERYSVEEVVGLFRSIKLDKYCSVVQEEEIDGFMLLDLVKNENLQDLGMSGVHQARLRKALLQRPQGGGASPAEPPERAAPPEGSREAPAGLEAAAGPQREDEEAARSEESPRQSDFHKRRQEAEIRARQKAERRKAEFSARAAPEAQVKEEAEAWEQARREAERGQADEEGRAEQEDEEAARSEEASRQTDFRKRRQDAEVRDRQKAAERREAEASARAAPEAQVKEEAEAWEQARREAERGRAEEAEGAEEAGRAEQEAARKKFLETRRRLERKKAEEEERCAEYMLREGGRAWKVEEEVARRENEARGKGKAFEDAVPQRADLPEFCRTAPGSLEAGLMSAVLADNADAVCKLLAKRADPQVMTDTAKLPLDEAVKARSYSVVAMLLLSRAFVEHAHRAFVTSGGDPVMQELVCTPIGEMQLESSFFLLHQSLDWVEARRHLLAAKVRLKEATTAWDFYKSTISMQNKAVEDIRARDAVAEQQQKAREEDVFDDMWAGVFDAFRIGQLAISN